MTPLEDKLRAAFRARADEIRPDAPPLCLPARRRRSAFLVYRGGEKSGARAQRSRPGWAAPVASAVSVAAVIAASALIFTGSRPVPSLPRAALPAPNRVSYLGVLDAGSLRSYEPVDEFARAAGRQPNLVGYVSNWYQPFEAPYAQAIHNHGAIPLVQIDPSAASVAGIAAGRYDGYLSAYAGSVRAFGHAVIIGFGHEMNGNWYPWGYGHVPPSVFVAAWRHIVALFRSRGADNVTWLWTVSAGSAGTGPIAAWWPGESYVTWVGIDGYYGRSANFAMIFGRTIAQIRALTSKPVLVSAVGLAPGSGPSAQITNLFNGTAEYGMLGFVWSGQEPLLRIEDDPVAATAFRQGASTLTLARP
jgi:mannan endo-1,4-beta-mannosidase